MADLREALQALADEHWDWKAGQTLHRRLREVLAAHPAPSLTEALTELIESIGTFDLDKWVTHADLAEKIRRLPAVLAAHPAPTVAISDEMVAKVLAEHGWEWGDGLDMLHCDCGWSIDAYIDYEDGLAERDAANAMTEGREIAAVIRHRAHVAAALTAALTEGGAR